MANSKFQRYNHSYNHCTGEGCELRDDCIHYLAYREAMDLGLKDIKTVHHCKDIDIDYVRVRIEEK